MWVTLKTVRQFRTKKSTQLLQAWASRSPQVKLMWCFPLLHYWPLPSTCRTSTQRRSSLANIFTISSPLQSNSPENAFHNITTCRVNQRPNCLSDWESALMRFPLKTRDESNLSTLNYRHLLRSFLHKGNENCNPNSTRMSGWSNLPPSYMTPDFGSITEPPSVETLLQWGTTTLLWNYLWTRAHNL